MAAKIIQGLAVAGAVREEIGQELIRLKERTGGKLPGLSIILVGDNPVSIIYVSSVEKNARALGLDVEVHRIPGDVTQERLLELIDRLNGDARVHGILLQLPLPYHIDDLEMLYAIRPEKDVDGYHPFNMGNLVTGRDSYIPCTPYGCLKILEYIDYDLQGRHAVVVGRSNNVGKPMSLLLLQKNATVTICHSHTNNLPEVCRQADVLVVAAGRPELVRAGWVKPGAVVLDVGINYVGDKVKGDVAYQEVSPVAGYLTPVPGGVGPITIIMLILNVLTSFKRYHDLE